MKQTKRLKIRQRVFRINDLKRIANIFDEQAHLAKQSDHTYTVEYNFLFADDTAFESETLDILDDTVVEIKRPVKVEFEFWCYEQNRRISLSITHGQGDYGNELRITADDPAWLNDNFSRLTDLINGAQPQSSWLTTLQWIFYILITIGIGSFINNFIVILLSSLEPSQFSQSNQEILEKFKYAFIIDRTWANWLAYFSLGWLMALPITGWLISAWPNIELDFGLDHLKTEKKKRTRITFVVTLIVLPVVLSIFIDFFV